jgi:hypothetical protein
MRPEEIALGLNEIPRQSGPAIGIVICQRSAERGQADSVLGALLHDSPPGILARRDRLTKTARP